MSLFEIFVEMELLKYEYKEQGVVGYINRSGGTAEKIVAGSCGHADEACSLKDPSAKGSKSGGLVRYRSIPGRSYPSTGAFHFLLDC